MLKEMSFGCFFFFLSFPVVNSLWRQEVVFFFHYWLWVTFECLLMWERHTSACVSSQSIVDSSVSLPSLSPLPSPLTESVCKSVDELKAVYRSFVRVEVWNRAVAQAFIQTSWFFSLPPLCHTEKRKTRDETWRRTDSFEVASQRTKWAEGVLRKKVTKQYRTVFMSAGFEQPFLFSSTTGREQDQNIDTIKKKKETVIRQASSSCSGPSHVGFCIFSNIHPCIHSYTHPPCHCVNYIPLQCHSFFFPHVL